MYWAEIASVIYFLLLITNGNRLGHNDRVWQVAWSPNGNMLASCSGDKTVRIWANTSHSDASKWDCIDVLDGAHKRTIRSVAWAPNGKELATASFDSTTGVWEYEEREKEWECVATLEGHENETKSVAWSANGSLLATCSRDKSVWIWEGTDRKAIRHV